MAAGSGRSSGLGMERLPDQLKWESGESLQAGFPQEEHGW